MTLAAGTRLGPYEILAPLGAGGMGEVYRARDTRLHREVAVKIPPEHLARDPEAMARFEREARAIAALSHPNILEIHDFGREGDTWFAVTELLRGETLRDRLTGKPLPWRRAVEIGLAVSEGLASAHEQGIVHRDLKPENVFLTSDGRVKILDFGLARHDAQKKQDLPTGVATSTATGVVMGTIGYMAPEQVRGQRADPRTDVFALGCVLYEMMTGRRAFAAESAADSLVAILREEPADPHDLVPGLPPEVRLLVMRCLEKAPESRFQSARDLAFALKLAGTATGVRPPSSRRTVLWAAVAAAALLAAAVLVVSRQRNTDGGADAAIDSLAVLPFTNARGNPQTQYLCDGLTESVINNLSQLPRLRVLPRTTVFAYKGGTDPQVAGRALKVRALVGGQVALRGEELVVQSELMDSRTGAQLWGKQYHRKLSEAFEVQQQIAQDISQSLKLRLSTEEERRLAQRHVPDPEAYLLYLNGRHHWNQRLGRGIAKSIEYFSRAIEKDPAYALPFVGLADAYALLGFYGVQPPREVMPMARDAAVRAIELDDKLAEAHATLADVRYLYDWDWRGAEVGFRHALALNPNYATGRQWYSSFLAVQGRLPEAEEEIRKARSLDPGSLVIQTDVGLARYYADDYDGAAREYRRVLALDPEFLLARIYLGLAHLRRGLHDEAVREFEAAARQEPADPDPIALAGYAHAVAGRRTEALAALARLKNLSEQRYVSAFPFAFVHVGLGDRDSAFGWLEKAYQERTARLVYLKVEHAFDPIRADPRFDDLLRRLRFPRAG